MIDFQVVDHFSENGLWKGYCASTGGHVMHIGYFPSEAVVIIDPSSEFSALILQRMTTIKTLNQLGQNFSGSFNSHIDRDIEML